MHFNSKGFTLSEVLITLTILGIIASVTIPNLISKNMEKEFITKLKKEYSALEEAYNMATITNGPVTSWDFGNSNTGGNSQADIFLQKLIPYLNIKKNCGQSDNTCVSTNTAYTTLNKNIAWNEPPSNNRYARAILKDDTLIFIYTITSKCNYKSGNGYICGYLRVDLNGEKAPNRLGVDVFEFNITDTKGLVPAGYFIDAPICSVKSTTAYNGTHCTYHVIKDGNMNYLH